MNIELFKTEIRAIRSRHRSQAEAGAEVFQFIRSVLQQLDGVPVPGEFKRALREELDAAFDALQGASEA